MLRDKACVAAFAVCVAASCAVGQVSGLPDIGMGWATVGDVGNPGYNVPPFTTAIAVTDGRGSVAYEFQITRSQISTGDYFEFYDTFSRTDARLAGLLDPGSAGLVRDPTYSGPGRGFVLDSSDPSAADRPIFVNRQAALMYSNWLHNGKSSNVDDLYRGAYDFSNAVDGNPVTHEPDARFRLPTLDEYVKAFYYDPNKNGEGPGYWEFPNQSDTESLPGAPESAAHPFGLGAEELVSLFGGFELRDLPLGTYADEQSQSSYGLFDAWSGENEILGQLEFIFPGSILQDVLGLETVEFSSSHRIPLNAQGIFGTSKAIDIGFSGFRIVSVIPAPSVLAIFFSVFMVPRRRRNARGGFQS